MFQPKDLLFTEVKLKIKLFLSKYGKKKPGIKDAEFNEVIVKYNNLVHDFAFQEKLQELAHLEKVIAQIHCMQEIDPRFVVADTSANNRLIYSRMPYPRVTTGVSIMTVSLGKLDEYGTNVKKMANDPVVVRTAKAKLLARMEDEYLYPSYKAKFS